MESWNSLFITTSRPSRLFPDRLRWQLSRYLVQVHRYIYTPVASKMGSLLRSISHVCIVGGHVLPYAMYLLLYIRWR